MKSIITGILLLTSSFAIAAESTCFGNVTIDSRLSNLVFERLSGTPIHSTNIEGFGIDIFVREDDSVMLVITNSDRKIKLYTHGALDKKKEFVHVTEIDGFRLFIACNR